MVLSVTKKKKKTEESQKFLRTKTLCAPISGTNLQQPCRKCLWAVGRV